VFTGQRQHVLADIKHALAPEYPAPDRHRARTTVEYGLLNRLRIAAPQPIVIAQVREAGCAARIRTVTARAIIYEQTLAGLQCLGIRRQRAYVLARITLVQLAEIVIRVFHFAL